MTAIIDPDIAMTTEEIKLKQLPDNIHFKYICDSTRLRLRSADWRI
jgi:hypothetical protein